MRSLACLRVMTALAGATLAPAQSPKTPPRAVKPLLDYIDPAGRFALDPPSGWRTLTPDEGRTLRGRGDKIPPELLEPEPPRLVTLGAIDQWLAGTFDGKALSIVVIDGEPQMDEAGLAAVRTHYATLTTRGPDRYTLADLSLSTVGTAKYPAVVATVAIDAAGAATRLRFDAYVPSGGETLSFTLSWPDSDRAGGETAFGALCTSLQVGVPARGSTKLGSKLLWAALLGLCIGVALHALRKRMTS